MVGGIRHGFPEGRVGCATRPGERPEWLFVVGRAFVAAVPIGTSASVVANLSALAAAADADAETVVSVLPIAGDFAVDTFVVVVLRGPLPPQPDRADGVAVSVVVRGDIAADIYSVGGSRRFTDRDIRPWLLADFQSVVGVVIGSPRFTAVGPGDLQRGHPTPLGDTVGDTLYWYLGPLAGPTPAGPSTDAAAPGAAAPSAGPSTAAVSPAPDLRLDDTVIRSPRTLDDTVIRPPAAALEDTVLRATPTPAGHLPAVLADESLPAADPPPRRPSPYAFRLGGEERLLDSVYYVGRRPVAPRIPTGPRPLLVAVPSRSRAVSATHLELRQEGDSVVVTDLGSTNGTVVRFARGRKQRLRSGESLAVVPGTTVDIGDGNIIEILPADGR